MLKLLLKKHIWLWRDLRAVKPLEGFPLTFTRNKISSISNTVITKYNKNALGSHRTYKFISPEWHKTIPFLIHNKDENKATLKLRQYLLGHTDSSTKSFLTAFKSSDLFKSTPCIPFSLPFPFVLMPQFYNYFCSVFPA